MPTSMPIEGNAHTAGLLDRYGFLLQLMHEFEAQRSSRAEMADAFLARHRTAQASV